MHILAIPDLQGVHIQIDRAVLVIGLVHGGAESHGPGLRALRDIPGGVSDDPGLGFRFLGNAFPEAAHGHCADFIAENAGRRMDLQLGLRRTDGSAGRLPHGGNDRRASGVDTGHQAVHGAHANGPQGRGVEDPGDRALGVRPSCGSGRGQIVSGHSPGQAAHGGIAGFGQGRCRKLRVQRRFHGGGNGRGVGGEIVPGSAFADARRDIFAYGLHTRRGAADYEGAVQRGFQIGGDGFGIRIPTGLHHALGDALADVRAGIGGVQTIQEGKNQLEVFNILLAHFLAVLDGGHDFGHIRG